MNVGNQHTDTAADGRGYRGVKSGKLGMRRTMRNMRQRWPRWSAAGRRWTLVMLAGGDKGGGRQKEGGRKVGYHSGSWLLEIAAPMPPLPLPASTLPPSSRHLGAGIYLAPLQKIF